MADRFRSLDGLVGALSDRSFDRPPAIVCNAHITGLGVARSLAARGVPVIALDRSPDGVAPYSDAVSLAGRVTYPLDDLDGFREDVERVADAVAGDPVAFPCMDEWVHAFAGARPDGIRLPFAADRIDGVLDKESLYAVADDLGVPHPETYRIRETATDGGVATGRVPEVRTAGEAADELGFPLVVKPALKREFEEAMGTNVIEVADRDGYDEVVEASREAGVRIMAQERIDVGAGQDRSFVSYVPPEGVEGALGVVGNPTRYPRTYGTSCAVRRVDDPTVEGHARSVLAETGYHGISEAEFIYDTRREEHVLLDVNTRPWKWIGLPVATGADLPYAAYADAVGEPFEPGELREATWVYLRDYLALLAEDGTADVLSREQWLSLLSGRFEDDPSLATAVYAPSDPGPAHRLLRTEFADREYYCAC